VVAVTGRIGKEEQEETERNFQAVCVPRQFWWTSFWEREMTFTVFSELAQVVILYEPDALMRWMHGIEPGGAL
jgi:hypothetical protein